MASVTLENIRKSYGKFPVLHNVNLKIADGEFVTLVGPSGCGKSTLLRMIAGLEEITDGRMAIGDKIVNELAPKERDIAMVFQSYALYPHMTVYKNMAFSLKMRRADAAQSHQMVIEAAKILGLEPLLNRLPGQLSGGQRQRVAMGRAIVRNPQVFLFDEPLSNLDAKLRVQMRAEIKSLHQRLGTTIVYVTHDQVEAMTMADRIVVMQNGHVQQVGSPMDLFDRPSNQFVASFIGSPAMNLLAGTIQGDVLVSGTARLPLPAPPLSHRGSVIYGIRPEYVALDASGTQARVTLVEPMGSETQVTVEVGGVSLVCLFRERVAMHPGDTIGIRIPTDHVHLFDEKSGKRL